MIGKLAKCLLTATLLFAGQALAPGVVALGQKASRDCTVRVESSGLVRGDRVPSGCVLRAETVPRLETSTPYVSCEPRKFYTPNPKTSVLTNCAHLSRGRMIIPTVPAVPPRTDGLSFNRNFGSLNRPFGSLHRPFGPVQRHFGPFQRNFGSRQGVHVPPRSGH